MLLGQGEPISEHIINPVVQGGFAAFAATMLGILVWMFRQLIGLQRESNEVINRNTQVVSQVHESVERSNAINEAVKDRILSRPCLRDREGGK